MPDLSSSVDLLRRFLVGEVSEAERRQIEDACLDRNSETFAAVVALEDELIADYASGRLTPAERHRLEERVVAHPGGRERLLFARALVERAKRAEASGEFAESTSTRVFWWMRPIVPVLLAAAVVLLAVATSLLFQQTRALRQQVADAQAAAARLAPSIVTAENRVKSLEDQLVQEQSRRQSLEAIVPEPRNQTNLGTSEPRNPGTVAALDLSPGVTRGPGAPLPQLDLRGKTWASLTLLLPQGAAAFPRYEVALLNAAGQTIWTISELRRLNGSITAFLPADRLTRDDYEVVVRGKPAQGASEDLANYYVRVVSR